MSRFSDVVAKAHELQTTLRAQGYDDDDVIASVDSETDLFRVFDRVVEKVISDQRLVVSARARAKRLEARADANLEFLDFLMRTMGQDSKVERPLATVFYQDNAPALQIDGEVPQYWLTAAPDKDRIKKALAKGEEIANCRLTQGRSLRVKTT